MLNRAIALIRSFTVVYVVDSLLFHAFFLLILAAVCRLFMCVYLI